MVDKKIRLEIFRMDNNRCITCGWDHVNPQNKEPILEAAHVMGDKKGGPDVPGNLISLCPNCHSLFDRLCFAFNPDSRLIEFHELFAGVLSPISDYFASSSISRIERGFLQFKYEEFCDLTSERAH